MSKQQLELAILQLMSAEGLGSRTLGRLLDAQLLAGEPIQDLVEMAPAELVQRYSIKPSVAQSIAAARDTAERIYDRLRDQGVRMYVRHIPPHPACQIDPDIQRSFRGRGVHVPPVLFAKGNQELLLQQSVCFAGSSKKVMPEASSAAAEYAARLATAGVNIISGYAKGVDLTAHRAALQTQGGTTTFYLPQGILSYRHKRPIADLLDEENHLFLSEFHPDFPWMKGLAVARSKTICLLCEVVVIVEARLPSGTYTTGSTALHVRPVYVVDHQPSITAPGNRTLIAQGAQRLPGLPKTDSHLPILRELNLLY